MINDNILTDKFSVDIIFFEDLIVRPHLCIHDVMFYVLRSPTYGFDGFEFCGFVQFFVHFCETYLTKI